MGRYIRLKEFAFLIAIAFALPLFSADKYWTGTTSGWASTAKNWCDDPELTVVSSAAPTTGDSIYLTSGSKAMTNNLNVAFASWYQSGYSGTVTFYTGKKNGTSQTLYGYSENSGETRYLKVTGDIVLNSGTWTAAYQPSLTSGYTAWKNGQGVYRIIVDAGGDVTIGSSATINLKGRGFSANQGPGKVATNKACANHAGIGSIYTADYSTNCYGVVRDPVTIGSGANYRGGGAVRIVCGGAMTLDGNIDVSGQNVNSCHLGAGGSISIIASSISGAGTLNADGGKGTGTQYDRGGGGGRISVVLTGTGEDFSSFTGTMTAKIPQSGANSCEEGAGGTIYTETAADGAGGGVLTIDNIAVNYSNMGMRAYTLLNASIYNVSPRKIVMKKGARVRFEVPGLQTLPPIEFVDDSAITANGFFQIAGTANLIMNTSPVTFPLWLAGGSISAGANGDGTYSVRSGDTFYVNGSSTVNGTLKVLSGGTVTHIKDIDPKMNLHVTGDLEVDSGGAVSATGKGGSSYGATTNKGGSYGGRARDANPVCYGSVRMPTAYGTASASNGGGAIRATVDGELVVNGAIRANGTAAQRRTGSGGSILLTANSISGTGEITANGGNQTGTNRESPGGGGRIAVYLTGAGEDFSAFTGKITAYGGSSKASGYVGKVDAGAGTVYLKTANQADNEGKLIVANSNTVAYATEIMTGNAFQKANVTASDVGEVVVDGAKLVVSNAALSVSRGIDTKASGRFACQPDGVVTMRDAAQDAYFYGTNTFWSFACEVPGKTLRFGTGAGDLFAVASGGSLSIAGDDESKVALRPAAAGEHWPISVPVSALSLYSVENVIAELSDASHGGKIVALYSQESPAGSCVNWNFPSASADGDDIVWTGGRGSGWNDADNWDLGRAPGVRDRILIPATANNPALPSSLTLADIEIASGASLSLSGCDLLVTDRFVVNGTMVCSASERIETTATNIVLASGSLVPAKSTFVISGDGYQTAAVNASFWNLGVEKSGGTLSWSGSSTTSRNLSFIASAATAVSFASGSSLAADSFHANGSAGGDAALALSGSWSLDVAKRARAYGVQIGGCDASGGSRLYATAQSVDLLGNQNCDFGSGLFVWTGEQNSVFGNGANWLGGVAPGENDVAEIPSAASITISSATSVGGLFLGGGSGSVTFTCRAPVEIAGPLYVGTNATLVLDSPASVGGYCIVDGTATHTAGANAETYKIDLSVDGDMLISEEGKVHANAKGYSPEKGPSCGFLGAGGSHGGCGSYYQTNVAPPCYGSFVAPVEYGSGGYVSSSSPGGGAVKISVGGTLCHFGAISADAGNGSAYTGAGGSVYLICGDLLGSGLISAVGGRASSSGVYETLAGGGGRISIVKTTAGDFSGFTGTVKAYGSYHLVTELSGQNPVGGAGSIAWTQLGQNPLVVVDNKNSSNSNCVGLQLPSASRADSSRVMKTLDFVVRNTAIVSLRGDVRINDLMLGAGTKLYLKGYTLTIRSKAHKNRAGWSGTVTYDGGQIIWEKDGLSIFVR